MKKIILFSITMLLFSGCSFSNKKTENKDIQPQAEKIESPENTEKKDKCSDLKEEDFAKYYKYKFEDYPADPKMEKPSRSLNLRSNSIGLEYRTAITIAYKEGPNFAGHYTVVTWGCGTGCQNQVVVDHLTGNILDAVITSSYGIDYKKDSRLLVSRSPVNWIENFGCAEELPSNVIFEYYYISDDGKKLVKLESKNENISATEVIKFETPQVLPNEIKEGSCWTNSLAAPYRTDAWRCSVGNEIIDPCFSITQSDQLICQYDPRNSDEAFLLKLTKPLPEHFITGNEGKENGAWFIEMKDGTICSPITGVSDVNEKGERDNYACSSSGDIYGELVKGTIWTTTDEREIKRVWQ